MQDSKKIEKALDNIGRQDDLVITQADKGGGVVILNKADYKKKMASC